MKRKIALFLSLILALATLLPSFAFADLGLFVDIVSGYVMAMRNHGVDIPLEYKMIPHETDPSKSYIVTERLTVLYRPGDMQAESAALLYMTLDDDSESGGDMFRASSFIEAIEGAAEKPMEQSYDMRFVMDIENKIGKAMDEREKLLKGEEVLFYSGRNANYYLSFPDEGLVIVAR